MRWKSAEQSQRLLRELWRVLADGGQALIVVPNRRGLWCLSESTPFGHGRPFSAAQLKEALRNNLFTPRRTARALFVPPSRSRLLLRTALVWERVGPALGQALRGRAADGRREADLRRAGRACGQAPRGAGLCAGAAGAGGRRAGLRRRLRGAGRPPRRAGSARTAPAR